MSSASPYVKASSQSTRTEQSVRNLVRAKLQAKAAWDCFCMKNIANRSEDEKIDDELESLRLCRALNAAEDALYAATRAP